MGEGSRHKVTSGLQVACFHKHDTDTCCRNLSDSI